ncbi:hypothetical protein RND81_05G041500 [Saponaria officinalis]|uniref:Uncharacterized protein n=1 Tax=Saponaria officinalis TaxID=3572 RepID=A0AAW1KU07_SAPOF
MLLMKEIRVGADGDALDVCNLQVGSSFGLLNTRGQQVQVQVGVGQQLHVLLEGFSVVFPDDLPPIFGDGGDEVAIKSNVKIENWASAMGELPCSNTLCNFDFKVPSNDLAFDFEFGVFSELNPTMADPMKFQVPSHCSWFVFQAKGRVATAQNSFYSLDLAFEFVRWVFDPGVLRLVSVFEAPRYSHDYEVFDFYAINIVHESSISSLAFENVITSKCKDMKIILTAYIFEVMYSKAHKSGFTCSNFENFICIKSRGSPLRYGIEIMAFRWINNAQFALKDCHT